MQTPYREKILLDNQKYLVSLFDIALKLLTFWISSYSLSVLSKVGHVTTVYLSAWFKLIVSWVTNHFSPTCSLFSAPAVCEIPHRCSKATIVTEITSCRSKEFAHSSVWLDFLSFLPSKASAAAAQATLLKQQEDLERKAAELDRRERELQSRAPTGH